MTFTVKHNDTVPSLVSILRDGSTRIDLSGYNSVEFYAEDRFQRIVIDDDTSGSVNVIDPTDGRVEYVYDSSDTSDIGPLFAEWTVKYSNGEIESFPSEGRQEIHISEGIK